MSYKYLDFHLKISFWKESEILPYIFVYDSEEDEQPQQQRLQQDVYLVNINFLTQNPDFTRHPKLLTIFAPVVGCMSTGQKGVLYVNTKSNIHVMLTVADFTHMYAVNKWIPEHLFF